MVLGGGAFGRSLGHKVGAPVSGINALIKRAPEGSPALPPREDTARSQRSAIQKGILTRV